MKSRNHQHLVVSETARVKLRKKNGIWMNVMSKVTSFVTRVFRSEAETENTSFGKSLLRGGVAAGVLMGGALMVPSQTAYAAELETEETLAEQDVVTLKEEVEEKTEAVEEKAEKTAPAEEKVEEKTQEAAPVEEKAEEKTKEAAPVEEKAEEKTQEAAPVEEKVEKKTEQAAPAEEKKSDEKKAVKRESSVKRFEASSEYT